MTSSSLPGGQVAKTYSATLVTSGGTSPFSWSVTSGSLPSGVALSASNGVLSGMPSIDGTFNFTVQVKDASGRTASRSLALTVAALALDMYGGIQALPSPNGGTGYFRTEKIGSRWVLVTPAGNAFFSTGVSTVTGASSTGTDRYGNSYPTYASRKYAIGQGPNDGFTFWRDRWAYYTRQRLQSWGFNTISTYSWYPATFDFSGSAPKSPPIGTLKANYMPQWITKAASGGPMKRNNIKNIYGPVFSRFYLPYFADVYDPNFPAAVAAQAPATEPWTTSPWVIAVFMDQTDQMRGVESSHPHLGFVVAATNFQMASDPRAYGGPKTYSDPTIYSKLALRDFLKTRYNNSLTAFNTAWGTSYTTWDSAGGWGVGTGFLDENGAHLGSWTLTNPSKPNYPAVFTDLDAFAVQFLRTFYSTVYNTFKSLHPNHLIATNNMVNPRSYTYQALADATGTNVYADLISVAATSGSPAGYAALKRPFFSVMPYVTAEDDSPLGVQGNVTSFAADDVNHQVTVTCGTCDFWWAGSPNYKLGGYILIQFAALPTTITQGTKTATQFYRIVKWNSPTQFTVASYSYFNGTYPQLKAALTAGSSFKRVVYFNQFGPFNTQTSRGNGYASTVNQAFSMAASNGDRFYVGVNQWAWMDEGWTNYFEAYNFGLVTLRDNAYNASEPNTSSGTDKFGFTRIPEDANYQDFLSAVTLTHKSVFYAIAAGL